jgi:hybrid cluster-associated redox disulfide protein
MKKAKSVKKTDTFEKIVKENPDAAMKLAEKGMFCCGCPMAMSETLEQGALAHNQDPEELVKELNKSTKK